MNPEEPPPPSPPPLSAEETAFKLACAQQLQQQGLLQQAPKQQAPAPQRPALQQPWVPILPPPPAPPAPLQNPPAPQPGPQPTLPPLPIKVRARDIQGEGKGYKGKKLDVPDSYKTPKSGQGSTPGGQPQPSSSPAPSSSSSSATSTAASQRTTTTTTTSSTPFPPLPTPPTPTSPAPSSSASSALSSSSSSTTSSPAPHSTSTPPHGAAYIRVPLEFTDLVNTSWWGFYKTFLQQVGAPGIAFLHAVQGYKERKPSWDSAKKILTDYDALLQDLPQDMYRNMWGAIDKKHQRTEEAPSLTLFDGAYNYCLSNVVGGSYKKSVRQGRAAFVKWLQAQGFKVQ